MAEYGVVLAVITVALVGAFTVLSGHIGNAINGVSKVLPGLSDPGTCGPSPDGRPTWIRPHTHQPRETATQ